MNHTIAFKVVENADPASQAGHWKLLTEPPYLQSLGGQPFVVTGCGPHKPRLFVCGCPVIQIQAVTRGDWVRVVEATGAQFVYRVGGSQGVVSANCDGRRCTFTGIPIDGLGVTCLACDRSYSPAAAEQIGECTCGSSLKSDVSVTFPGEELL